MPAVISDSLTGPGHCSLLTMELHEGCGWFLCAHVVCGRTQTFACDTSLVMPFACVGFLPGWMMMSTLSVGFLSRQVLEGCHLGDRKGSHYVGHKADTNALVTAVSETPLLLLPPTRRLSAR